MNYKKMPLSLKLKPFEFASFLLLIIFFPINSIFNFSKTKGNSLIIYIAINWKIYNLWLSTLQFPTKSEMKKHFFFSKIKIIL